MPIGNLEDELASVSQQIDDTVENREGGQLDSRDDEERSGHHVAPPVLDGDVPGREPLPKCSLVEQHSRDDAHDTDGHHPATS